MSLLPSDGHHPCPAFGACRFCKGLPHEFYSYEGLKHYFSTRADDATMCNQRLVAYQMFRDSLDCLRRWLGDG